MVLLVRAEKVSFRVEAESFVQEPFAAFCVRLFTVVIRLIAATDELFATAQFHRKAKLLCFGGSDIEKGHISVVDSASFSVGNTDQMQPVTDKTSLFLWEELFGRLWSREITSA